MVKPFESRLFAVTSIASWFTAAISLADAAEETVTKTPSRTAIEQGSVFGAAR